MNYQTQEVENGTLIRVEADEAAVIIREDGEERIYLPEADQHDTTYYTDSTRGLEEGEGGWSVVHTGKIDEIQVFHN